ncbi:GNAT family N-acetyltransferase [Pseudorhizobium banfieldiae]|uniref:GNAT family N-acetyltransferase n=1 Tax=Pseudorhizobium banfieldiae TaxID=1125847 RepID=UPI000A7F9C16|nr:GNAT family N-acetyltransferase [Pseudorhizobium banfieldiae]CAD6618401.1 N-acetyltransferase [arsenite-oxidising bacterium NT-25]
MNDYCNIRRLTFEEVELLLDWARKEGWNPGLADATAFYNADPAGFIGCFSDDRLVAGISAVRYTGNFGFIGLYICLENYRGRGFGKRVWDAGMHLLTGRIVGLDGVPEQQENYARKGFVEAYKTIRWSGRIDLLRPSTEACSSISPQMVREIVAYDAQKFPCGREAFLGAWLQPPRQAIAVEHDGAITGYAVVRRCHHGCKIGPLFADSLEDAEWLLNACVNLAPNETLHVDVPEMQTAFSRILEGHGMAPSFATARMYKNGKPRLDTNGVFALTTLELG